MATKTAPNPIADAVETATERFTALNEQVAAQGREAGTAYVASYEHAVLTLADTYEQAAGATNVDWVAEVAMAHADFAREVIKAQASAARELVA